MPSFQLSVHLVMRLPSWLCFPCFLENPCSAFKTQWVKEASLIPGSSWWWPVRVNWVTVKVPGHRPLILLIHRTFCWITKSKKYFATQERVKYRGRAGSSKTDRHLLTYTAPCPRICLAKLLLLKQVRYLPQSPHNLKQNSVLLKMTEVSTTCWAATIAHSKQPQSKKEMVYVTLN